MSHRGGASTQRAVAAILCALVLAASWNIPFGKRSAERFPCESCACGCADAFECWTNCCCHTEAERVAWAKANGVEPPAWFHPHAATAEASAEPTALPPCCAGRAAESASTAKAPSPRSLDPATCKAKPKLAATALVLFVALRPQRYQLVLARCDAGPLARPTGRERVFPLGIEPPPPRAG